MAIAPGPLNMDFPLKLDNTTSINWVFTPVNIAILTSLGLHGFVLGLALPHLTWPQPTQESFKDRTPVAVIELMPAEQSRLPNLNPLPVPPLFPSVPGGELPSARPAQPSLPPAPDSNYDYQLPDISGLPPLPTMPSLPNLPAYPPNLPPLTNYGNFSRLPIQPPSLPSLPTQQVPRLPAPTPSRPPLNTLSVPSPPPNDPARPRFEPLPPPQGPDLITKAPQSQNSDKRITQPELIAEGEDSSPAQVQLNSLNSIAKQGIAIKDTDLITGTYPPNACQNQTEAKVIYNVFPNGQKDLVGRSRYVMFNELAAQAISKQSYAQPTQVTVSFQYNPDVCADVNQSASPSLPQVAPPSQSTGSAIPASPASIPPTSAATPESQTPPTPSSPSPTDPQRPTSQTLAPSPPTPQPSVIQENPSPKVRPSTMSQRLTVGPESAKTSTWLSPRSYQLGPQMGTLTPLVLNQPGKQGLFAPDSPNQLLLGDSRVPYELPRNDLFKRSATTDPFLNR